MCDSPIKNQTQLTTLKNDINKNVYKTRGIERGPFIHLFFVILYSCTLFLTDIDSTSLVRVIVINNVTGTLTPSQACALTSSQPVGTQELLVRSGMFNTKV